MNQDAFAAATIPEITQAFRGYGNQINNSDEGDKAIRNVV